MNTQIIVYLGGLAIVLMIVVVASITKYKEHHKV